MIIMSSSSSPSTIPPTPKLHHKSNTPLSLLDEPPPPPSLQTQSIRTRLSKLCQDGNLHIAHQLFDTLPKPSTALWNTIIIGYICNKLPTDALLFYSRMRSTSKVKCDSYTYSSVLKACAETRSGRIGRAVHGQVVRSQFDGNSSKVVYNSLLNMYSACLLSGGGSGRVLLSRVDVVKRVFDTMKKRDVVAWNIMVSWLVKTERFREAVIHFRGMLRMQIKPTAVSFVNVFPAVSRTCDYELARVLYGMIMKLGGGFVDDMFVVSSAIVMFSELGCLGLARKVFDGCLNKNVEVWNSMIGGYLKNNCYVEALELFVDGLGSRHVVLDDVSYISALTTASQLQQVDIVQQLHALVLKSSKSLSVTVMNGVIVMYSRCNCILESFRVFGEMVKRDVVSWNTIVTALVQNGMYEEGLMLVYEMQKQGFVVDEVTVIALLSAASNLRSEYIGKQTHAYIIRNGIIFQGMDGYLVDMYAKVGLIQKAQIIFEQSSDVNRDQATWNAMLSGKTQNGLMVEAFTLFRQMLEKHVFPNAVSLASLLPACSQIGSIALGKQLHAFAIRQSLDQNVFVGTALVSMYSKLGAISLAERVFAAVPTKNPVTYTNMIVGYGQHGMGAKALSLFSEMQTLGLKPDAITLIAMLSACCYTGLVDEGLHIFESMEAKYGIVPSTEHCACVVDMLGRDGRIGEAFELAQKLGEDGSAIQAWGSLLAACRSHGQYELAKMIASKLLDMESKSSRSGYYVQLSNIFSDEGDWEIADRVRKEMWERGQTKEAGCSWIEVYGSVNYFTSKDSKHQQCEQIYEMLDMLVANMEDAGYSFLSCPMLDQNQKLISEP